MSNIIRHNDQWIPEGPAFAFNDRIRLGDGVFDTMLVIIKPNSTPQFIHVEQHFKRLLLGLKTLEITTSYTIETLEEVAKTLIEKNNPSSGRYAINTVISRGSGPRGLLPPTNITPTLIMNLTPLPNSFPKITAITARRTFRNEGSPLSQIKSCNYGDNILALMEARNKNANEAIILNNAGHITCTTSGNIFMVLEHILYTPPLSDGVLNGITRDILMQKFEVIETSLNITDLNNATGLYVTNSIRGCLPISTLNGKPLCEPTITIKQDIHIP